MSLKAKVSDQIKSQERGRLGRIHAERHANPELLRKLHQKTQSIDYGLNTVSWLMGFYILERPSTEEGDPHIVDVTRYNKYTGTIQRRSVQSDTTGQVVTYAPIAGANYSMQLRVYSRAGKRFRLPVEGRCRLHIETIADDASTPTVVASSGTWSKGEVYIELPPNEWVTISAIAYFDKPALFKGFSGITNYIDMWEDPSETPIPAPDWYELDTGEGVMQTGTLDPKVGSSYVDVRFKAPSLQAGQNIEAYGVYRYRKEDTEWSIFEEIDTSIQDKTISVSRTGLFPYNAVDVFSPGMDLYVGATLVGKAVEVVRVPHNYMLNASFEDAAFDKWTTSTTGTATITQDTVDFKWGATSARGQGTTGETAYIEPTNYRSPISGSPAYVEVDQDANGPYTIRFWYKVASGVGPKLQITYLDSTSTQQGQDEINLPVHTYGDWVEYSVTIYPHDETWRDFTFTNASVERMQIRFYFFDNPSEATDSYVDGFTISYALTDTQQQPFPRFHEGQQGTWIKLDQTPAVSSGTLAIYKYDKMIRESLSVDDVVDSASSADVEIVVRDTDVKAGESYVYRVDARTRTGNRSPKVALSKPISAGDTTAPSHVTGLTAVAQVNGIQLDWTNPSDSDFRGVNIYEGSVAAANLVATLNSLPGQKQGTYIANLAGATTLYVTTFDHNQNENTTPTVPSATETPVGGGASSWGINGDDIYNTNAGGVVIGGTVAGALLDVQDNGQTVFTALTRVLADDENVWLTYWRSVGQDQDYGWFIDSSGNLKLNDASASVTAFSVAPGGAVGIGGVPSSGTQAEIYKTQTDSTSDTKLALTTNHGTDKDIVLHFGRTGFIGGDYGSQIISRMSSVTVYGSTLTLRTHSNTTGVWNTGMIMDVNGNVGIGTTSPVSKLDVRGTAPTITIRDDKDGSWSLGDSFGKIDFYTEDGSDGAGVVARIEGYHSSTGPDASTYGGVKIYAGGRGSSLDPTLYVDAFERVGINADPLATLWINRPSGQVSQYLVSGNNNGAIIALERFGSNDNYFIVETGDNAVDRFRIYPSGVAVGDGLHMDTSGNVGIGTGTPQSKLHTLLATDLDGIRLESNSTSVRPMFRFIKPSVIDNSVIGFTRYFNGSNVVGDIYVIAENSVNNSASVMFDAYNAGSANTLTWHYTGKLGIGQSSPSTTLDLNAASPTIRFRDSDTGDLFYIGTPGFASNDFYIQSATHIRFATDGPNERMRLTGGTLSMIDGNGIVVGHTSKVEWAGHTPEVQALGSGTGASSGDSELLVARFSTDVAGPQLILGKSRNASLGGITYPNSGDGLGTVVFAGAFDANSRFDTGALVGANAGSTWTVSNRESYVSVYTTASGSTTATERMRITGDGNVGIGTETPGTKLEVVGAHVSGKGIIYGNASDHAYLVLNATSTNESAVSLSRGGAIKWNVVNRGASSDRLAISDGTTDFFNITTTGNVGIGDTSPTEAKLVVRTTGSNEPTLFLTNSAGGSPTGNVFEIQTGIAASTYDFINVQTNLFVVRGDGNVGIGTSSPNNKLTVNGDANISDGFGLIVGHTTQVQAFGSSSKPELQVLGTGAEDSALFVGRFSADNGGPSFVLGKSRDGSLGGYSFPLGGDLLGSIDYAGSHDSANQTFNPGAYIRAYASGTWSATSRPTHLTFDTTNTSEAAPTERVRITGDGNVGIGTDTPSARLEVKGGHALVFGPDNANLYLKGVTGANHNSLFLLDTGGTGYGGLAGDTDGGNIFLWTGTGPAGNERLSVTSGGNVGIGTTSPLSLLSVNLSTDVSSISNSAANYPIWLRAADTDTFQGLIGVSEGGDTLNSAMGVFDDGGGGAQGWWFATGNNTSISERMRITSSGNVLIGNPAQTGNKLGVVGDIVAMADATANARLVSVSHNGTVGVIESTYWGSGGYTDLIFQAGGTEVVRFDTDGNVGIGTSAPSNLLDVRKDQNGSTIARVYNNTAGTGANARLNLTSDAGNFEFMIFSSAYTTSNQYTADSGLVEADALSGGLGLSAKSSTPIKFWTNDTERMEISGGGVVTIASELTVNDPAFHVDGITANVGIGTTSPQNKLHLWTSSSAAKTTPLLLENNGGGTGTEVALKLALFGQTYGAEITTKSTNGTPNFLDPDMIFSVTARGTTTMTERMRLDGNGNLGIGTSSPGATLHVSSANGVTGTNLGNFYVTTTDAQAIDKGGYISFGGVYTGSTLTNWAGIAGRKENGTDANYAGYLAFSTRPNGGNDTERMRIASTGNVGIGNSPHAWGSIKTGITIGGYGFINHDTSTAAGGQYHISQNYYWNGTNDVYAVTDEAADYFMLSGTHVFRVAPSGTAGTAITWTEGLRVTNDGDVGIGNDPATSASYRLLRIGAGASKAGLLQLENTSGNVIGQFYTSGTSEARLEALGASALHFWTNSTNRMSISGGGVVTIDNELTVNSTAFHVDGITADVGIGTTSPGYKLDIRQSAATGAALAVYTGSGTSYPTLLVSGGIDARTYPSVGQGHYIRVHNASGVPRVMLQSVMPGAGEPNLILLADGAGNVGIGTTSPGQKLTVQAAASVNIHISQTDNSIQANFGTDSAGPYVTTVTNHSLRLATNNSERMRITSGGNVGIGTSVPGAKFTVQSGSVQLEATSNVNDAELNSVWSSNDYFGDDDPLAKISFRNTAVYTHGGMEIAFYTRNDQAGSLSERMRISNTGNVGIGTSSPQRLLELSSSSDTFLRITSGAAQAPQIEFYQGSNGRGIIYGNSWGLHSTSQFFIDSSGGLAVGSGYVNTSAPTNGAIIEGRVGIGTSSPTSSTMFEVKTSNDGGVPNGFVFKGQDNVTKVNIGNSWNGASYHGAISLNDSSGTAKMLLRGDGTNYINGGNLGIGIDTPAYVLDVYANASTTYAAYIENANAVISHGLYVRVQNSDSASDGLRIDNATVPVFRVRMNSQVGIKHATPEDFPTTIGQLVVGDGSSGFGLQIFTGTSSTGAIYFGDGTASGDRSRGSIQYIHATNTMTIGTDAVTAISINSSQDVTVNQDLYVSGESEISGGLYVQGAGSNPASGEWLKIAQSAGQVQFTAYDYTGANYESFLFASSTFGVYPNGGGTPSIYADSDGHVSFNATAATNKAFTITTGATAAGASVYGVWVNGTYTAAANSDGLYAFRLDPTFAKSTYTGLATYGLYIGNPTTSGTGTIGTAYGIYVTGPSVGTTNYGLYVQSEQSYFGDYVGINDTTPDSALHITHNGAGNAGSIRWENVATEGDIWVGGEYNFNGRWELYNISQSKSAITATYDGVSGILVGINHNDPGFPLDVNNDSGSSGGSVMRVRNRDASGNIYGVSIVFSAQSPDDTTSQFLSCSDSTATRCIIYSNGDLGNDNNVYGGISDERLKDNITSARSYWDDFRALAYKTYQRTLDIDRHGTSAPWQFGLIAQDVEAIFPSLVSEGNDGYKWVKTSIIHEIGMCVLHEAQDRIIDLEEHRRFMSARIYDIDLAVMSNKAEIEVLHPELATVKGRVDTAESEIDDLKRRVQELEDETVALRAEIDLLKAA